ncbi:MAG: helix-turn-helix transcriptional regulator, partial [Coriobacteriaceae bacterium]|nr:helix-turn-helix transcriptional regulator [Coriobacteriaceae bacterium]
QKGSSNNENVASSEQPIINADADAVCALLAKENGLTPRQADVMRLLVKGVSIQRIAETLGLSDSTVATYRKAIYAALDVHARQELLDLVETQVHMRH